MEQARINTIEKLQVCAREHAIACQKELLELVMVNAEENALKESYISKILGFIDQLNHIKSEL